MLHRYGHGGSGSAAAAAPCSFSVLFPVSGKQGMEEAADGGGAVSSSVDCTLTLGTPCTRYLSSSSSSSSVMQRSSSRASFCWDALPQPGKVSPSAVESRGTNLNGDPFLLARRCANCDTTSTPLWRNGPRGPKSLCNACGIRYKKEERRAAASSTAMASPAAPAAGEGMSCGYSRTQPPQLWSCYAPAVGTAKSSALSVYAGETEERYLPWRLNVVPQQFRDRSGLSQYQ